MNVQLVANFAANGQLILAAQGNAYTAPDEIAGMGLAKASACGNVVWGLTTYQMFAGFYKDLLKDLEVVVLNPEDVEGDVYTAKSPEDAVRYLESKGYETVCVDGGAMTYSSFLQAGLADELFFNFFPVVIQGGASLETAPGKVLGYKLAEVKAVGDVASLHFVKE
ncbi:MAG: dihydrofolate reductase family protein [Clostridiales bacterium]|nr:dihydrofolate reductase family protein [Clostridiales bacterium]